MQHSIVAFKLDSDALKMLVGESSYGSLDHLAERAGVHRATMYRWSRGENLPTEPSRLLALSNALDVDPLVLWRLDRSLYSKAESFVRSVTMTRSWSAIFGGLSYLDSLFFPAFDWPASGIARDLGHDWKAAEFGHEPQVRANYYQRVLLTSKRRWQVWYFAYRNPGRVLEAWQPYGVIVRKPNIARLFSVTAYDEIDIAEETGTIAVETWFGPGPAEFKVCSMHPVEVSLVGALGGDALQFRL